MVVIHSRVYPSLLTSVFGALRYDYALLEEPALAVIADNRLMELDNLGLYPWLYHSVQGRTVSMRNPNFSSFIAMHVLVIVIGNIV